MPSSTCRMPHVKLNLWKYFLSHISICQHHNILAACRLPRTACQTHTLTIYSFDVSIVNWPLAACRMPDVKLIHWIHFISKFQYDHNSKLAACCLPHANLPFENIFFFVYQYADIMIYLPLAACHMPHVKLTLWKYFLFRISICWHHNILAVCRLPHAACQTYTLTIYYFDGSIRSS